MNRFLTGRASVLALAFLFLFALPGCKKEDPNPELLDLIFADLNARKGEAEKSLDEEKKKIEDAQKRLSKAEPNSIELKDALRDLAKSQRLVAEWEQKALYYKIRAERRMLVDRITYKAAFAKNKPWPDPREYSDYQVNMRLQEAPRNWAVRVPKLRDRLSRAPANAKTDGKKEAEKAD